MNQLSGPVLQWIREGYPDGVPDEETAALLAVLQERIGGDRALDVLRRLHSDGRISDTAAAALLPDDTQMRRVAAKLVLGGWPLAGDDEDEDSPPKEGSALARIVSWLREGYPGGVPEHDYMPLIALLERRLTRSEVKKVAKALRRADVSPAGPERHRGRDHRVHPHRAQRQRPAPGARPAGQEGLAGRVPRPRPGLTGSGPGHSNARPASLTDGRHWLRGLRAQGSRPSRRAERAR